VSAIFTMEEVLEYSDHERRKWKAWIASDPTRLSMTFQPGARFPTVWALLDHIFFVERRHLSRMEGAVPPEATGVAPGDWQALFEYADLVRADLREYLGRLTEVEGSGTVTFTLPAGPLTITRRRLALHVVLHEARHLAQLAYAARLAGHEPPGGHDYLFFPAAHEATGT
jgi:uncharacterized damage-inducible protein DinB